jgi:hypothetical protein
MKAKQYQSFCFLLLPWQASICPTLHYASESSRCCSSVDCVCSAYRYRVVPCGTDGTALNGLSLPSFLGNKSYNCHQLHDVALNFKMRAINGNDSVGFTTATLNIKSHLIIQSAYIYRVIKNDCRGSNNLTYTIHII